MPMSDYTKSAWITTGGNVGIGGADFLSQFFFNRSNRRFARQQYQQQLSDNIALMNAENAYNTPSAQMARFKNAGLNPNLVYGMQNMSAPVSSAQPLNPNTSAPQLGDLSFDSLLQAKQFELENRKLDIEEKRVDKENEVSDATIRQIFKGFDLTDAQIAEKRSIVQLNIKSMDELDANIALLNERQRAQFLENLFNERSMESRISLLESEAKIKRDESTLFVQLYKAQIEEKLGNAAAARASVAQYQATARKLNFEVEEIMPSLKILYDNQANKEDKLAAIADIEGKIKKAFGYDQAQADIVSKLLASDPNVKDFVHKVGNGKVKTANWLEDQINKLTYGKGKKK